MQFTHRLAGFMTETRFQLPTLIATSVVRGSRQGESHGGIYLVDFAKQEVIQVVDWDTSEIDFTGRGWDRGLRGIAFFGDEIYIAASDELFVYDQNFKIQRSFRNPYLKHCHEICQLNDHLYLTSTGHDSVLAFDLKKQVFFWALHLALVDGAATGTAYNPADANGPAATNHLHLNNVFADHRGIWVSGMRTGGLLRIGDGNSVDLMVELPMGIHNARPFGNGVLFNDTASNYLRHEIRDGTGIRMPIPQYDVSELTHTELGDEKVARQGFGRGLCVINEQFIAAGSSPSTVTVYHLPSGTEVTRVNFSMDIRNAIHGLEVWPFG